MNADEIMRALKSNAEVNHHAAVMMMAADLIETLQAQLAAKNAEIERLSQLAMMREGEIGDRDREIGLMTEAQRWRNAETEPPKCEDGAETGPILYRVKTTGTIEVGYYGRKGRWRDSYFRHMRNASDGVDADDVSDWMPLPAAPEEGAEK